jgi:hypothetical protein
MSCETTIKLKSNGRFRAGPGGRCTLPAQRLSQTLHPRELRQQSPQYRFRRRAALFPAFVPPTSAAAIARAIRRCHFRRRDHRSFCPYHCRRY